MRYKRRVSALIVTFVLVGFVICSAVAVPAVPDGPVGTASAQDADEAGEEESEEGGIEGQVEGAIEGYGLLGAVFVLLLGGLILIAFVEKLISYISRAATGLGISVFSLAIVFTGFEFDDTILALVFASGGMEEVALGTALGTALAILGITLAVAAIARPFSVSIPRDYLALLFVSPLVLVPLVVLGTLTTIHGLFLIALFFVFLGYIIWMEARRDVPVFRETDLLSEDGTEADDPSVEADGGVTPADRLEPIPEDRFVGELSVAKFVWLGLAVLSLIGIVAGSILIETGSEVVIEESGIEETIYGATIITLLLTFENVLLTLEPVRRGIPEIGIGHVIGSVVFSVTANIGFILLIADLSIGSTVLLFHMPALLISTALGAYFISTGTLKRWHGYVIGGLYVAYWLVALFVFGGVPISG